MNALRHIMSRIFNRLLAASIVAEHHGIRLCDVNNNLNDDGPFISRTKQALDLILEIDARRFLRLQRTIRYIVNKELFSGGAYLPCGVCAIDFGRYRFDLDENLAIFQMAGLMIHESTHGLLESKNLSHLRRRWVQVERICRSEQNRFLKRLEPRYGGPLQRPFNPNDWVIMRPLNYRIRTLLRRNKEEKQKARQSGAGHPPQGAVSSVP
jgi:hypothetical protein